MTNTPAIIFRRFAVALLVTGAFACGHFHPGADTPARARIFFSNESLDEAAVYAVRSGGDGIRIGTVFPGHTDTLVVPADIANAGATVNLVARILAHSFAPQSGPIVIHAGDEFVVRLPADQRVLVVLPP